VAVQAGALNEIPSRHVLEALTEITHKRSIISAKV
jgi:hypothetical protein